MKKVNVSMFLALAIVLSLTGAALAAKVAIDTTNDVWDAGWGTVFMTDANGDSTGPAGTDIQEFYVNVNPAEDEYYLGVILDAAPPNDIHYVADIDCDDDSLRNEEEDAIVLAYADFSGQFGGAGAGDASYTYASTNQGEIVSINRFESRSHSSVIYPQATCFAGNRSFRLRSCDNRGCSTVYDETNIRYLDLPTAVTLQSITANNNSSFLLAAAVFFLLAAASGFIAWRKR